VSPWQAPDHQAIQWAEKPHDYERWYREPADARGVARKESVTEPAARAGKKS